MVRPFERLTAAPDDREARWALDRMRGRDGVARVVPDGFEVAVRIMHPLEDGERWADVAPRYLGRGGRYEHPYPDDLVVDEGNLAPEAVDALIPLLAASTATPDRCHYGVWTGWGGFTPGAHATLYASDEPVGRLGRLRARREPARLGRAEELRYQPVYKFVGTCAVAEWWGGRDMFLFDGAVDAVVSISDGPAEPDGTLSRCSPQWWWPHDRAWFLGTEIDYGWTYLVGQSSLTAAVAALPSIESVVIDVTDPW